MGDIRLDDRGRLTLPVEVRERLQLEEGAAFDVEVEGNTVKLHYERPDLQRVQADREWGSEAFRDAGDALYSGGERDE